MLHDVASLQRGYVLVTGSTGMGKSTTLATMIEEVNRARKSKIITVEDPIEFVFTHDKSIITQREVGTDTSSFSHALRAALRQDPDVIMVGEMRDLETVDMSLKAAETGHLVFSSIHTSDVSSTINRLVSFFPAEEQLNVRQRLADNLKAVVSLRLLPNKKQNGARTRRGDHAEHAHASSECIKDPAKTSEITEYIARGRSEGNADLRSAPARPDARQQDLGGDRAFRRDEPMDFKTKLALEGGDPDT